MWEKISRYYPTSWELLLLFLLFLSFWYPYIHYAEMPPRIPTHFGGSGIPDAWSPKNPVNVFLAPSIMTVVYFFITGLTLWMASVPDPKKLINASRQQLERIAPERAELVRQVTIRGLFGIKALLSGMSAYLSYASTRVALGKATGLGWLMVVFTAGLMLAALYLALKTTLLVYRNQ